MSRRVLAVLVLLLAAAAPSAAQRRGRLRGEPVEPPVVPVVPLHPPRVATEPVTFVWPPEGLAVSAEATFILGSVAVATAPFRINGTSVAVHRDGGFLAYLPISSGTFVFRAELDLPQGSTVAERRILVAGPPAPFGDKLAFDEASLWPRTDLEVRAGDWLTARARGTPGKKARVRAGRGEWRDLRETAPGVYDAAWPVAAGEEFPPEPLEYELKDGWSKAHGKSAGRASAQARSSWFAAVKPNPAGFAALKTGPSNGFLMFPPTGVRMPVTGRDGGSLRVQLASNLSGWIEAKDVDLSSGGAPARAVTGSIGVVALSSSSIVRLSLTDRVPFAGEVAEDLGSFTLRLYGAVGHTNWVAYDIKDDLIDEIRWTQEATDVVAVKVLLKPGRALWGWHAAYDGAASSLRLELRKPPLVSASRPFEGVRVMLDPGHMPSATGATGPLGTKEMDANYAIALAVEERLRRDGATVLMTRSSPTHEVGLVERPRQALERGADLFVSLHNNALPDGSNPWAKPRGFTVFYYHPHSLELARNVHKGFRVRVPLADEGLQWANLLVARLSAMPAILVENAHMIFPEQEASLNDPKFRAKLADAVVDGLRETLREAGRRRR